MVAKQQRGERMRMIDAHALCASHDSTVVLQGTGRGVAWRDPNLRSKSPFFSHDTTIVCGYTFRSSYLYILDPLSCTASAI